MCINGLDSGTMPQAVNAAQWATPSQAQPSESDLTDACIGTFAPSNP